MQGDNRRPQRKRPEGVRTGEDFPLHVPRVWPESFTAKAARGEFRRQMERRKKTGGNRPFPYRNRTAVPVGAARPERQLQAPATEVDVLARTFRATFYQSNSGALSTASPAEEKWIMLISA